MIAENAWCSFDCLLERSDKTKAGFKQQIDGKTKFINFRMLKITERNNIMTINSFSEADIKAFEPAEKIGIIATVTPEGLPHISLLTSVMAAKPRQLIVGEFCKGKSKEYMQRTRKIGFAILTLDKKLWLGKALWTHLKKEGAGI